MKTILIPAVIQNNRTGQVLMVGYMNDEALIRTKNTGWVWFWSRSKKRLWKKGESSGNCLRVTSIYRDCDDDAYLIRVSPVGPTCHSGNISCFYRKENI